MFHRTTSCRCASLWNVPRCDCDFFFLSALLSFLRFFLAASFLLPSNPFVARSQRVSTAGLAVGQKSGGAPLPEVGCLFRVSDRAERQEQRSLRSLGPLRGRGAIAGAGGGATAGGLFVSAVTGRWAEIRGGTTDTRNKQPTSGPGSCGTKTYRTFSSRMVWISDLVSFGRLRDVRRVQEPSASATRENV